MFSCETKWQNQVVVHSIMQNIDSLVYCVDTDSDNIYFLYICNIPCSDFT